MKRYLKTGVIAPWYLGIATLAIVGLTGCGGGGSAPSTPPAPPRFQPQTIQITLGSSGETVTLMTTQAGGYTRDGQAFSSGTEVTASNGNVYTLTLEGGNWRATYKVVEVSVMLGTSGTDVNISRNEDGTYAYVIGGGAAAPLRDGDIVTAPNDNQYQLSLVSGEWSAAFVAPDAVVVALGPAALGGGSATISRKEDGTYAYAIGSGPEAALMDGDTVTAANDNRYRLSLVSGEWTAAFVAPDAVVVALGPAALGGGSATISRKEDGTYAYAIGSGPEAALMDGDTVTAANDNQYRLSLVSGEWTAAFVAPDAVVVALGPAALGGGSATISRKEDGSYAYAIGSGPEAALMDGDTVTAANDNQYRLSLVGGEWTAAFVAPDAVVVALGPAALGGGSATISRKEDGSYAYAIGSGPEAALMDGDTVTAANDNQYRLSLVGGEWTAAFVAPDAVVVALGPPVLGGGSATISRREDGSYVYAIGSGAQTALVDGDTVTAANDNRYRLSLVGGEWTAAFVAPDAVVVALGPPVLGGGSATISRKENGTYAYSIGSGPEAPLADGDTVTAANDNRYRLSLVGGEWTAAFVDPAAVTLALGPPEFGGGSATISRREDGSYVYAIGSGAQTALVDGDTVTAANDNRYRLSLVGGEWTAAFVAPDPVVVALGPPVLGGGSATISRKENGSYVYSIGSGPEAPLADGDTVTAANGNQYQMTYNASSGQWSPNFRAEVLPIANAGVTATRNEARDGFAVGTQTLQANGMGDISTAQGNFHVHMDANGNLVGVQYEAPVGTVVGTASAVTVSPDDMMTTLNETGTMIDIDGVDYSIGTLFTAGRETAEGPNVVAAVREEVAKLASQVRALGRVKQQDPTANYGDNFRQRWKDIDEQLNKIFGDASPDAEDHLTAAHYDHLDPLPGAGGTALTSSQANAMLADLAEIETALGTRTDFVTGAATGGLFNKSLTAQQAGDAFDALMSVSTSSLATTPNTRYGVFSKQVRVLATDPLGPATTGVFAYSPLQAARAADLPGSGAATHQGGTIAIAGDKQTVYTGDISLEVRFRSRRVTGLVSNLIDGNGRAFRHGFGTVDHISLGEASTITNGSFSKTPASTAQIIFTAVPGSPPATTLPANGSTFSGQFVDGGAAAIGTWSIGDDSDAEDLKGAFGVEEHQRIPDRIPPVLDLGAGAVTIVSTDLASGDETVQLVGTNAVLVYDDAANIFEAGADLYTNAGATTTGSNFVAQARDDIAGLLARLDTAIELHNRGDPANANTVRDGIWADLNDALEDVFGAMDILGVNYPRDTNGDRDDAVARQMIEDTRTALGTLTAFQNAGEAGQILDVAGALQGTTATQRQEIFERVEYTIVTESLYTDYTRFGVWHRTDSADATQAPAPPAAPTLDGGSYAYSPLAQSDYSTADPNFPGGGNATYSGKTIARDATNNTYYQGNIRFDVTWEPNVSNAADVGDLGILISDLRDGGGNLYQDGGNDVSDIVFSLTIDIQREPVGTPDNIVNGLFFDGVSGWRMRHSDINQSDTIGGSGATAEGKFVGKSIDGPAGVLGSWTLNSAGHDLRGAYGADIAP